MSASMNPSFGETTFTSGDEKNHAVNVHHSRNITDGTVVGVVEGGFIMDGSSSSRAGWNHKGMEIGFEEADYCLQAI